MGKPLKKSFNLDSDLEETLSAITRHNHGVTLTMIFNQALRVWLKDPNVQFNGGPESPVRMPTPARGLPWGDLTEQISELS